MSEDLLREGDLPEEEITRAENRWLLVVCAIAVLIVATFPLSVGLFQNAPPSSLESIPPDQIYQSGERSAATATARKTGSRRQDSIASAFRVMPPSDKTGLSSRCMADDRNVTKVSGVIISIGAITRPTTSG